MEPSKSPEHLPAAIRKHRQRSQAKRKKKVPKDNNRAPEPNRSTQTPSLSESNELLVKRPTMEDTSSLGTKNQRIEMRKQIEDALLSRTHAERADGPTHRLLTALVELGEIEDPCANLLDLLCIWRRVLVGEATAREVEERVPEVQPYVRGVIGDLYVIDQIKRQAYICIRIIKKGSLSNNQ